jgi:hypothetical protein
LVVQTARLGEKFVRADKIVSMTNTTASEELAVLDAIIAEMAKEAAAIGYEARRLASEGREGAARASGRRIRALLAIGRVALLRERRRADLGEMSEEQTGTLVRMVFAEVRHVAEDVLPDGLATGFLDALERQCREGRLPGFADMGTGPVDVGVT